MPEGPLPPFPTTGCGGAVAGVHSKCDRQGENPWLAGGILASLAGLFDHLEEGLCWRGMDDDHVEAVTRVAAASAAAAALAIVSWDFWFAPCVSPAWLLEPVVLRIEIAPRMGDLLHAAGAIVGACALAVAMLCHLLLCWALRWRLSRPRLTAACLAYVGLWHIFHEHRSAEPDD